MFKTNRTALSSLAALLIMNIPGPAWAESLSLQQAIDEALKESPSIEKAEAQLQGAEWKLVSQRSDLLPKLNAYVYHSFDMKDETLPFAVGPISASVPIAFPRTSYGLEADWVIFDGLANWNKTEAASLRKEAATAARSREQFEVRKKIELQYYAVLAAIQMSEVAHQNLKTIEDSLAISQARLRNGVSTAPDVLRVQVQETEAKAEVQRTGDTIAIQREKLRQTMGLDHDDRELSGALPTPSAKSTVAALQFSGVENRDDIKAQQFEDKAAEREHAAAIGSFLPAVSLTGHIENYDNTDYSMSDHNGSYRAAYDVGVSLKWRLLDGGETIAKPGLASAKEKLAQSELRKDTLNAPTDFELWKRRYTYSSDLYEARIHDIQRAEESLRIIKLSFGQGRRIINEVLDAETDLFRARAGAVQSQFEAAEALNQLELVVGKDLL